MGPTCMPVNGAIRAKQNVTERCHGAAHVSGVAPYAELEHENAQLRRGSLQSGVTEPRSISQPELPIPESHPFTDEPEEDQSLSQSAGSLQRTPEEEIRYLGSSNGVDFVDIVERVVHSSCTKGGLFGRVTDSHRMPERIAFPSIPQPAVVVDHSVAMPLIESYFDHWHLLFPLIYRPAFMEMVREIYSDPKLYQNNPSNAFALDIVLALGSVSSKRVDSGHLNSESYFARASMHLDEVSGLRDIRSLQALLLYCKYGIHASLRDTSSEMWEVLGRASRLCVEIGLHQNSTTVSSRCKTHITGKVPSSVQLEMQRRCFWCYYNLERIVNISLGRPLALHDDDIDVPLPSPLDDDGLEHVPGSTASLRDISPFLQHTHLRKIQSRIHRSMYTSRSIQRLQLHDREALRQDIYRDLQAWQRNISLLPLPSPEHIRDITSSYLHPSWYHALYNSSCLLLFRPSVTFPAMEGLESNTDVDDVLQTIWTSSRMVLARYFELLRARHLNYSWVCLYTIFMAGLANIYSVGCCVQRRKRSTHAFLPSFWDVTSDVRDCSNILTAICEKWDDARGSCDIFNQLSMSALKELASMTFQQKDDNASSAERENNQMNTRLVSSVAENGLQTYSSAMSAQSYLPQLSPSPGFPETTMSTEQYHDTSFSEMDPILDFQHMFQEMQNAINTRGDIQTDEVMLGFSQDWFGR
ncbi:fungal-specific transcription factor domain-containing protein [Penicillium atrosanguineum]|uniref:Fungal-specific transcription factor domain-containing protein n=1 Tax=Penicillium atrosanguineum TaxID=1132637 RepID=A0A9W9GQJ8_9EURO|nr:fungal-specific transcription factor domain-containing protein [Penicillium atrosanguineum]KAJ5147342.1 fungal-specific transcription factor domain-containing protein [Penicillium atrosanguineum]KAJ5331346.1 fungal-specific transcription factor domain-containing protein [Penicillium atrosanguineum]